MRIRVLSTLVLTAVTLIVPGQVAGQRTATEVMVAAGRWASARLPSGSVRVDPHRTGRGADQSLARRMARELGAELGTVEEMQQCDNVLDPSTCKLACDALLAVAMPSVDGNRASVRVYAWHRQDDPRSPVGKVTWDVSLRRAAGGWEVVGAERRP